MHFKNSTYFATMEDTSFVNYKGVLQELSQARCIDLPEYETISSYGWKSQVLFDGVVYHGGGHFIRKKDAEQAAAKVAYKSNFKTDLNAPSYQYEYSVPSTAKGGCTKRTPDNIISHTKTLVLIDLENYPNINTSDFCNTTFIGIQFIAFVGRCSSHAEKNLSMIYPFVDNFVIVESVHRDAVDHYISMYAGSEIVDRYERIVIVTRDRFGGPLVENVKQFCKEKFGDWDINNETSSEVENIETFHAVNATECFDYIKSNGKCTTKEEYKSCVTELLNT
jgi:hypothetical protein